MKAKHAEKPVNKKRASALKTTNESECAAAPETPSASERASGAETPKVDERAIADETSRKTERAMAVETPTPLERFFSPEQVESLRIFTRCFYDYQEERTALDGQLGMTKDGEAKKGTPHRDETMLGFLLERRHSILALEHDMKLQVGRLIRKHPLWVNFLRDVKGVGEMMAAVMITQFDIHKATTVSKMWQFSGMNPGQVHGKKWKKLPGGRRELIVTDTMVRGDKKEKGFVCPFNAFLKAKMLGVLGSSFLKSSSPYRTYYDNMKHRLESSDWGTASKHPTDPARPKAGHQHKAANRYMVKQFLRDLYVAWRTLEGLEVRPPYAEEFLSKKHAS